MSRPLLRALLIGLLLAEGCESGTSTDQFEVGLQALQQGNFAEAYCRWRPLAEHGYADAQYHLGWLYANGNGMNVDMQQALDWWTEAARQGHADAQFAVGLAYTTGEGMQKDLNEAIIWYLAAARQGHQDARDILVQLNGDPGVHLLELHPEVAREGWFGWSARVAGERINVRAGPGTDQKIVAQVEKGSAVRVIGQRGDWYMVVLPPAASGNTAWIYKSLVSAVSR